MTTEQVPSMPYLRRMLATARKHRDQATDPDARKAWDDTVSDIGNQMITRHAMLQLADVTTGDLPPDEIVSTR